MSVCSQMAMEVFRVCGAEMVDGLEVGHRVIQHVFGD